MKRLLAHDEEIEFLMAELAGLQGRVEEELESTQHRVRQSGPGHRADVEQALHRLAMINFWVLRLHQARPTNGIS